MRGTISAVLCFAFLMLVAPEAMAGGCGGSGIRVIKKINLLTVVIEESVMSGDYKTNLLNFLESGKKLAVSSTMESNKRKRKQLAYDAHSILGKATKMLEEHKIAANN